MLLKVEYVSLGGCKMGFDGSERFKPTERGLGGRILENEELLW